jgi:hypothetical protein
MGEGCAGEDYQVETLHATSPHHKDIISRTRRDVACNVSTGQPRFIIPIVETLHATSLQANHDFLYHRRDVACNVSTGKPRFIIPS